jgi:DNA-binding transcriptional MerR regulator
LSTIRSISPDSNPNRLAKYTMAVTVMMTGVAAHKIRKFEEYGLCSPARTESKQRLYSDDDIELIRRIARLEKNGVNLPGIKLILEMQGSLRGEKI